MRLFSSWTLIAIAIGIFVLGLLLSIYYGIFLLFLFLPIGFIWNAFRGNRPDRRRTVRSGAQIICANCGTILGEKMIFCPTCGQMVRESMRDSDLR